MALLFDFFHYDFVWRALIAGVLVAACCAALGMFLVLRNLSLISDGLSHIGFGTIAIGLFFGIYPLYVSLPLVIAASLLILRLTKRGTGDAAIGMVSAIGVAVGVIVASLNHGVNVDMMSYLFGNILTISPLEMWLAVALSLVVMTMIYIFYWDFFATTFDNNYAEAMGVRTLFINRLLMILTAVVVVLSIRVVGAVLVSALIIFPAMTALRLSQQFKIAMGLALMVSLLSVVVGMFASFIFNLPTGATIVVINGVFFLGAVLLGLARKK
ncbi:MAG: metal ABC transporter permease [Hydrotalea sp.]|nr:metal ABC transporter permease [Hydrotalea sp.]